MVQPLYSEDKTAALGTDPVLPLNKACKIALLCGGSSSEREVSLSSAVNVEKALASAGHDVTKVDTAAPDFFVTMQRIQPDVAFIALHGKGGEDGEIQAVLEFMGIPYTGSGVLGSALCLDKHRTKIIYEAIGVKTAPWLCLKAKEKDSIATSSEYILSKMNLPLVVKPSDDGSSVGITIVSASDELPDALANAFASGSDVLVEKYIFGTEVTVSVIGSDELLALPAIEIVPKNEFYDYESKYTDQGSKHIIPARLNEEVLARLDQAALLSHEALGCFGVSRTDMIVDSEDEVWAIETNTIPGMTSTSLLPDAARHKGISCQRLYELLIVWALERAAEKGSQQDV